MSEFGTDIHRSWTFTNGDLLLASDETNVAQAIQNRISTNYDELGLYYAEYGSLLRTYLGEKRTAENLEFINIEIRNRLESEPRVYNVEVESEYTEDGGITVKIDGMFGVENEFEVNLIMDNTGEVTIDGSG